MSNENRPKKSWREIDRSREGGSSSRGSDSSRRDPGAERDSKQYRAALEALFNGGGLGKLADKLAPLPQRSGPPLASSPPITPIGEAGEDSGDAITEAAPVAAKEEAAVTPPAKGKKKQLPPLDDRLSLRKKVLEATGRHEISRATEKYLERYPLPEDHEFLEQVLEHDKEARVTEAMERIGTLLDQGMTPRRSRALCGKLRYLQDTTGNEDLRERARALLGKLG